MSLRVMNLKYRAMFPLYRNQPIDLLCSGFYAMKVLIANGVRVY